MRLPRAHPEHLTRPQRLIERLARLPRDSQDRIIDAVLVLLQARDAANPPSPPDPQPHP